MTKLHGRVQRAGLQMAITRIAPLYVTDETRRNETRRDEPEKKMESAMCRCTASVPCSVESNKHKQQLESTFSSNKLDDPVVTATLRLYANLGFSRLNWYETVSMRASHVSLIGTCAVSTNTA